jgi:hypothetical protein
MGLLLYFIGSLAGVALMIGLNVALFGRKRARLASQAEAEAMLAAEVPGFRAGRFALAADGGGALMENAGDATLYLIAPVGQKFVSRKLDRAALKTISRTSGGLTLQLADFTFPQLTLKLDAAQSGDWEQRLDKMLR